MTHNKLTPREGDLPDVTILLLKDLERVAPDIARVLVKYMPAPPENMGFSPSDAVKTIMAYCDRMLDFWDYGHQQSMNRQLAQLKKWLDAIAAYQRKVENEIG